MDNINSYKIKVNTFTSEISKPLNRNLRTLVTAEVEIYEESSVDNQDSTFDCIYRSKLVGSTIIQQQGVREQIIGKSKRSWSKKWKSCVWSVNPDDEYYEKIMSKMVGNFEDVINYIEKL